MRLIESKAEYIPQEEGLEGIYKQIELAGRTAYNSQDKITPDSAKDFVDRMTKSHHGACLEHGTVYLMIPLDYNAKYEGDNYAGGTRVDFVEKCPYYETNSYSKSSVIHLNSDMKYPNVPYGYNFKGGIKYQIVTTNFRVLQENNWLDDLQYLCSPTEFHEKRYTMRFTCDRGVSHQLVRERLMSFLQESQRYCSYIKEKFGASVTFIQPDWIKTSDQKEFEEDIKAVEKLYFKWLNKGYKAEEARYFLINGTKTEIVVTGFAFDWRHMLDLRYFEKTGKVSPDMKDLMQKAQKSMQEAGIWEDIMSKHSKFE